MLIQLQSKQTNHSSEVKVKSKKMPKIKSTDEARKALLDASAKWREDYAAARSIKEANMTSTQVLETVLIIFSVMGYT